MATRYLARLRRPTTGASFTTLLSSDPKSSGLLAEEKHWIVCIRRPSTQLTKHQLLDVYVKTLAKVVGSEDEAKKRIYQANTGVRIFRASMSWEHAQTLKELPWVHRVGRDQSAKNFNTNQGVLVIDRKVVPHNEAFQNSESNNKIEGNDGTVGELPNMVQPKKKPNAWSIFMVNVLHHERKYKSVEEMFHRFMIFETKMDQFNQSINGCRYPVNQFFDLTLKEYHAQKQLFKESEMDHERKEHGELVIDKQVVPYDESESVNKIGGKHGELGIRPHNNDPEKTPNEWDLFMDNVIRFKKRYKNSEHMMLRFEIFKGNLKKIGELNSCSKDGPSHDWTCTFDKSQEEIERIHQ